MKKQKEKHSLTVNSEVTSKCVTGDALSDSKVRQPTIGSRLGSVRRAEGLSISSFSSKTGIPSSSLKKYESNHSMPGAEALQSIARFGINVQWLLTGEGPTRLGVIHPDAEPDGPVDREVLREVLRVLESVLQERGQVLAPHNKAELILLLCDEITEQEGKMPSRDKIFRLLKLVG